MKKKVVSVLLCVAMTATMLLGCSAGSEKSDSKKSSKSESGGTTEMKVDGDATTINVWTFIELHQKFYTEMAKKWNEAHPDKKVKLVLSNMQYDDMHNKLSLALESGKGAPDVVDIELGKFPSFTNGKIGLMDLTDAIAPYKDNVVESRLDIYGKDGKYYGFPTHVGTTVAFYNDDLLKEAGIDDIGLCTDEKIHTTLAMVHTYPDGDRDFSFYRNPGADMMLNKTEISEDILKETEMQISKKL